MENSDKQKQVEKLKKDSKDADQKYKSLQSEIDKLKKERKSETTELTTKNDKLNQNIVELNKNLETAKSSAEMVPVMSLGALLTGAFIVYILTSQGLI